MRLILCHDCGIDEVKPGEVSCWKCLGEQIPLDPDYFLIFGHETPSPYTNRVINFYPISIGDSNTVTFTYTATFDTAITGFYARGASYPQDLHLVSGDSLLINFDAKL